jgi:hypothetical protein
MAVNRGRKPAAEQNYKDYEHYCTVPAKICKTVGGAESPMRSLYCARSGDDSLIVLATHSRQARHTVVWPIIFSTPGKAALTSRFKPPLTPRRGAIIFFKFLRRRLTYLHYACQAVLSTRRKGRNRHHPANRRRCKECKTLSNGSWIPQ